MDFQEMGRPQEEEPPLFTGCRQDGSLSSGGSERQAQIDLGQVPLAMREEKRWVNHRADKVPCDANGKPIDATNPANHLTVEDALENAIASNGKLGLGFALGDGWQGIDLDNVEANSLQALANSLSGYKEYSPSLRGCHAIGRGGSFPPLKMNGIEAYSGKRYFTVTGNAIGGEICDLAPFVAELRERLRPKPEEAERPAQPDTEPTESDEAIVALILRNPALAALYNGDTSACASHSEAELGLCNAIAARSRNRAQTKRMMLAAPLCQRAKTQKRADYLLDRIIEMAFDFKPKPEAASQPQSSTNYVNLPTYADASTWDDKEPEARLWVGDSFAPKGHVTFLVSDGGGFKTLGGQQLGTCITTNNKFLNKYVIQGVVATYNCEDDLTESHRRQLRLNRYYKTKPGPGRLHFRSLVGCAGNELATWDRDGVMKPTATFHNLRSDLLYLKPDVVFLDNLTHFFGGNENIRSHAAGFCSLLEGLAAETGAAIIIIAHYNKDGKISGSTGWLNHVRHVVEFRKVPNQPGKRQIWIKKSNYGPSKFVWAEFRYFNGVLVRDEDLPPDVAAEVKANEQIRLENETFLACLDAITAQRRPVSHHNGSNYAPTIFARMPEAGGITRMAFEQVMERLFHSRAIIADQFLWNDSYRKPKHGIKRAEKCGDPPAVTPCGDLRQPPSQVIDNAAATPRAATPLYINISGAAPLGSDAPPFEEEGGDGDE